MGLTCFPLHAANFRRFFFLCCLTSTQTSWGLSRTGRPGRPPRLSHSLTCFSPSPHSQKLYSCERVPVCMCVFVYVCTRVASPDTILRCINTPLLKKIRLLNAHHLILLTDSTQAAKASFCLGFKRTSS